MRSRDEEAFALLMERGTGKSKIIIDTAAWLYMRGRINMLVVVAPNGVHRNWIVNEVPVHLPDHIEYRSAYWVSSPTKAQQAALDHVVAPDFDGLRIIAINVETFSHKRGTVFLRKLGRYFKPLLCVDESSRIKEPSAKRTKTLTAAAVHFPYRRILTGTAITQGPLDFFAQFKFLDPHILGYTTFASFRAHYAKMLEADHPLVQAILRKGAKWAPKIVDTYRNLDELKRTVAPYSYVARKADCLDLPPKVYEKVYVDLGPAQKKLYRSVENNTLTEMIADGRLDRNSSTEDMWDALLGEAVSDTNKRIKQGNALTKLLRLQQIIGGFVTVEDDDENRTLEVLPDSKRVATLMDVLSDEHGKVIVWARFVPELLAIIKAISDQYGKESVVAYHGAVSADNRSLAQLLFQDEEEISNVSPDDLEAYIVRPDYKSHREVVTSVKPGAVSEFIVTIYKESKVRFFVAQQHSGGLGLTLTKAELVMYYSNDFSLEARLQSEDRAHRIGQTKTVTYIDLVASGTVDERILDALRKKEIMADDIIDGVKAAWDESL